MRKPRIFYGYIIVAASFISMMTVFGTYQAFGVFFKSLLGELGWTRAMTSGAFSLSMIISGLLGIVMGRLTDRIGPRLVLSLCGFAFGLGYLLMSQTRALWQMYLFYGIIIGTGLSGTWVPIMSTVVRWFTRRRGLATGVVQTGIAIGGLFIPVMATQLISAHDWRTAYLIMGTAVLVIAVLAAQFLRRGRANHEQTPDISNEVKTSGPETRGFSLEEAAHTRQFWLFLGMEFCFGFSMWAVLVHIVPHATDIGISAVSAATILVTVNALGIAGRIGLGSAGDRIGNRNIYLICFALLAVSLFWLLSARELWQFYLFAAIFGLAFGGGAASDSPLTAELFGLSSHGMIYGVISAGFNAGASIGPFLVGYIFDITGSYQTAFLITTGISLLGLILSASLRPIRTLVRVREKR